MINKQTPYLRQPHPHLNRTKLAQTRSSSGERRQWTISDAPLLCIMARLMVLRVGSYARFAWSNGVLCIMHCFIQCFLRWCVRTQIDWPSLLLYMYESHTVFYGTVSSSARGDNHCTRMITNEFLKQKLARATIIYVRKESELIRRRNSKICEMAVISDISIERHSPINLSMDQGEVLHLYNCGCTNSAGGNKPLVGPRAWSDCAVGCFLA